jgi:hypothetical protein
MGFAGSLVAADLRFLHHLRRVCLEVFKPKRHQNHTLASAFRLSKFASEVAAQYQWRRLFRGDLRPVSIGFEAAVRNIGIM